MGSAHGVWAATNLGPGRGSMRTVESPERWQVSAERGKHLTSDPSFWEKREGETRAWEPGEARRGGQRGVGCEGVRCGRTGALWRSRRPQGEGRHRAQPIGREGTCASHSCDRARTRTLLGNQRQPRAPRSGRKPAVDGPARPRAPQTGGRVQRKHRARHPGHATGTRQAQEPGPPSTTGAPQLPFPATLSRPSTHRHPVTPGGRPQGNRRRAAITAQSMHSPCTRHGLSEERGGPGQ